MILQDILLEYVDILSYIPKLQMIPTNGNHVGL